VRADAKADEDNGPAPAQSLGQEDSIALTQSNLAEAEGELHHKLVAPQNFFQHPEALQTQNLGQDEEVEALKESLALAEKRLNHKMATPDREEQGVLAAKNLELDEDISQAQKNLA